MNFLDAPAAQIAHRRTNPADQLLDDRQHRPLVRHAAFDTLRHQFVNVGRTVLKVAIRRTLSHRTERAHATIGFVGTTLKQFDLAWCLVGTGKQATKHDGVGTSGNRLADVAGIAHTTVGNQRHTAAAQGFGHVMDGSDLRHTDPGNDACGTDRTRADSYLDAVRTMIDQCLRGLTGSDVAADHLNAGETPLDPAHPLQHPLRVTMRGIDDKHVNPGFGQ